MIGDEDVERLNAKATYMFVEPDLERVSVIERVNEDRLPTYHVLARTRCLWCAHWCWLGDKSFELIASGGAQPMCHECAEKHLPDDAVLINVLKNTGPGDKP